MDGKGRSATMIPWILSFSLLGAISGAQSLDATPSPPGPLVFPPPGTEPTEYVILDTWEWTSGGALFPTETEPESPRPSPPAVHDGMLIGSEEEYRSTFGKASEDIDWETQRILVFQELTVYKFGELESSSALGGIHQSDGMIYVGRRISQHSPVQGIAQQSEWFSYRWRTLLILLPREPEAIQRLDLGLDREGYDVP